MSDKVKYLVEEEVPEEEVPETTILDEYNKVRRATKTPYKLVKIRNRARLKMAKKTKKEQRNKIKYG